MKNLTLTLVLIVLATVTAFSQNEKKGTELSKIRKNKNHLDLDVKNIFNSLTSATLIYKRTFKTGELINVNSINLIRFSGQVNNQITLTEDPTRTTTTDDDVDIRFFPSNILDFQVGLGIERQKMNKNFVHYFGVDAVYSLAKIDDDISNGAIGGITVNVVETTDRLMRTMKTGLNPFIGIKYYFTNRISLGLETGFSVLYFSQETIELSFESEVVNGDVVSELVEAEPFIATGILTDFNNLRFLTIGYTF